MAEDYLKILRASFLEEWRFQGSNSEAIFLSVLDKLKISYPRELTPKELRAWCLLQGEKLPMQYEDIQDISGVGRVSELWLVNLSRSKIPLFPTITEYTETIRRFINL